MEQTQKSKIFTWVARILLATSILAIIASIGFFVTETQRYNNATSYWGEFMAGNDYWLHPTNQFISALELDQVYMGRFVELSDITENSFAISYLSSTDPNNPQLFKVVLPNLIEASSVFWSKAEIDEQGRTISRYVPIDLDFLKEKLKPDQLFIVIKRSSLTGETPEYIYNFNINDDIQADLS